MGCDESTRRRREPWRAGRARRAASPLVPQHASRRRAAQRRSGAFARPIPRSAARATTASRSRLHGMVAHLLRLNSSTSDLKESPMNGSMNTSAYVDQVREASMRAGFFTWLVASDVAAVALRVMTCLRPVNAVIALHRWQGLWCRAAPPRSSSPSARSWRWPHYSFSPCCHWCAPHFTTARPRWMALERQRLPCGRNHRRLGFWPHQFGWRRDTDGVG